MSLDVSSPESVDMRLSPPGLAPSCPLARSCFFSLARLLVVSSSSPRRVLSLEAWKSATSLLLVSPFKPPKRVPASGPYCHSFLLSQATRFALRLSPQSVLHAFRHNHSRLPTFHTPFSLLVNIHSLYNTHTWLHRFRISPSFAPASWK